jgi:hypothetical protein
MISSDANTQSVKALIESFFSAINASDNKALQSLFFPSASLAIIRQDPPLPQNSPPPPPDENKITVVMRTNIETFIKLVEEGERKRKREGKKGPELVETPDLAGTKVEVDGGFGMAWSPFEVTFDGKLHHYGIMAYTLGRESGGAWRVEGLTQSYRRTPGWD